VSLFTPHPSLLEVLALVRALAADRALDVRPVLQAAYGARHAIGTFRATEAQRDAWRNGAPTL